MSNIVKIHKIRENCKLPTTATKGSAGADIYACIDTKLIIKPGETAFIPTGFSLALPENYVGLIFARSGLATKEGLAPANKVGVIDSDYRGEVGIVLYNQSKTNRAIMPQQRIAQLVVVPYVPAVFEEVDKLEETVRGEGGYGSTGK